MDGLRATSKSIKFHENEKEAPTVSYSSRFASLNDNDLSVFAFMVEAILAFFISGFYLLFKDKRQEMQEFLISLPMTKW